jgi:hypothetical protein
MPRKQPRTRTLSTNTKPDSPIAPDVKTALVLGAAHIAHGSTQALGETATAACKVLESAVATFGECFVSFMGYMKEREISNRVIAQEVAATERMQIWSSTVIAAAEEQTERVKIQASLVLAALYEEKDRRELKMEVIRGFMKEYSRWNEMLTNSLGARSVGMPLDERELLQGHINVLLSRAREMELSISNIAATL